MILKQLMISIVVPNSTFILLLIFMRISLRYKKWVLPMAIDVKLQWMTHCLTQASNPFSKIWLSTWRLALSPIICVSFLSIVLACLILKHVRGLLRWKIGNRLVQIVWTVKVYITFSETSTCRWNVGLTTRSCPCWRAIKSERRLFAHLMERTSTRLSWIFPRMRFSWFALHWMNRTFCVKCWLEWSFLDLVFVLMHIVHILANSRSFIHVCCRIWIPLSFIFLLGLLLIIFTTLNIVEILLAISGSWYKILAATVIILIPTKVWTDILISLFLLQKHLGHQPLLLLGCSWSLLLSLSWLLIIGITKLIRILILKLN